MSIALYRRHRQQCKAGHPHNTRTSEYDERKKGWKRCECPIFASGTLSGAFKRQNSGQWEWDDAKAIAAGWEQAGSWDDKVAHLPAPVSIVDATAVPRIAIA